MENITSKEINIIIDDEELISLRDFGYLSQEGLETENEVLITSAIHNVIADLWKTIIK